VVLISDEICVDKADRIQCGTVHGFTEDSRVVVMLAAASRTPLSQSQISNRSGVSDVVIVFYCLL